MAQLPKTQNVVLLTGTSDSYETIQYTQVDAPTITSPKDIIIKNAYAGVNFIEGYFRKGYYAAKFPYLLGREASGTIAAVGDDVTDYKVGDKVFYLLGSTFAEYTKITTDVYGITKIPDNVTDDEFKIYGSILIQALTAYSLAEGPYTPKKGEYVLVWAAAGGVGTILVQILSQRGVNVIAVASTAEKLEYVKKLGAQYTINYKKEDVPTRVHEITGGQLAKVSYDSTGQANFQKSIDSLGRAGFLLSYGNASGKVPPVDLYSLPRNIFVGRPGAINYADNKENYDHYVDEIVKDYKSGKVQFDIPHTYPLKDYAKVAELLELGTTTGKFVLKI